MESLHAWAERWSDLGGMLAALGTLLAVVVSVWVAVREAGSRKEAEKRAETAEHERAAVQERADRERAEQAEERRLEQARQVIAWVEHRSVNPSAPHFDSTGLRPLAREHVLHLVNHSTAPVFDVALHIYFQDLNGDIKLAEHSVIPAGGSLTLPLPEGHQESGFSATGLVIFRDLAGVRRRRWENGTFNELNEHGQEIRGPHR